MTHASSAKTAGRTNLCVGRSSASRSNRIRARPMQTLTELLESNVNRFQVPWNQPELFFSWIPQVLPGVLRVHWNDWCRQLGGVCESWLSVLTTLAGIAVQAFPFWHSPCFFQEDQFWRKGVKWGLLAQMSPGRLGFCILWTVLASQKPSYKKETSDLMFRQEWAVMGFNFPPSMFQPWPPKGPLRPLRSREVEPLER